MASNRSSGKVGRKNRSVGLYIHIPFCQKKCFYCDFYSIENQSRREEFLTALLQEIKIFAATHGRLEADTIFFGGGTPSLLTPDELNRILTALHETFVLSEGIEFTMECNPGTVDVEYLFEYRALGANRLSFGVQSFFEDELTFLERIHGPAEPAKAIDLARRAGFDNISIDLIYALPNQTVERLIYNLNTALSLNPDHVSAYSLIVEPGTPLFTEVSAGRISPAGEALEARMYDIVMDVMEKNGYTHYEISNYARRGFECRHNLKYWNAEEYIGFGPSAHSYFDGRRSWNVSSLSSYVLAIDSHSLPVSASETLSPAQLFDEFVLLHLRQGLLDPVDLKTIFGVDIDRGFVRDMIDSGYCAEDGRSIRLTRKGFAVCDEIAETLLSRHSIRA